MRGLMVAFGTFIFAGSLAMALGVSDGIATGIGIGAGLICAGLYGIFD